MIDLSMHQLQIIQEILAKWAPGWEVRAFGSRCNATARSYSDLDLAIIAPQKLTLRASGALREAFIESALPFRVDLLDWQTLSPEFQQEIERNSIVLQASDMPLAQANA
jgi:type I restriction enzyme S subunit